MRTMIAKIDKDLAAVFLLLLIIGFFFYPLIFEGKTLFFRDLTVLVYSMKHFIFKAYHAGALPFWDPAVYGGTPFFAQMYPGVLYPPNLIFFLNDFTGAFNWFYIFHYVLLGLSVYGLTRYLGVSVGGALCSALTALLSGFFLSLPGTTTPFYSSVWLPSIFYFAQRYLREKKIAYFLGAVFCLSCQILGGSPEFSALTLITLFFWLLALAPEARWGQRVLRCAPVLAAMVLLSCGIAATQLVPTFFLTKETRRGEGLSFDAHAKWSMSPAELETLLNPRDWTGFMEATPPPPSPLPLFQSLHMGLFAAFFLCAGFLYIKHRAIRFWVFAFFVGIFFALGKYNPLYHSLYEWVPLVKLFRYPEKFYLIPAYSQIFLVGYGVDALINSLKEQKIQKYYWIILALSLGMAGVALDMPSRNPMPSFAYLAIFGVSLFFSGRLGALGLKSILGVLIFLSLILNNYMLLPMIDKKFYEEEPKAAREVKDEFSRVYVGEIEGPPESYPIPETLWARQIMIRDMLFPDLGAIHGINYADGGRGWSLESRDQWLWMEIFDKSPPEKRLRMLKRSNAKYWIEPEAETDDTPIRARVRKLDGALPRAFLAGKSRTEKDPQLLNVYYDEAFDPLKEVLLGEPAALDATADFDGAVEEIRYAPNQVVIRTRQNGAGFLVLVDAWFPGWTVTVDGAPQHIFRANHFYRGVQLSSGTHTLLFEYEPVGFRMGLWIFAATLTLIAVMLFLSWRKQGLRES